MIPERGDELKVRRIDIPIRNRKLGDFRKVPLGAMQLTVGEHYWFGAQYVRFIKVTAKGFNFLDEATSRCVLYPHIYATGYRGQPIPTGQEWFCTHCGGTYGKDCVDTALDQAHCNKEKP